MLFYILAIPSVGAWRDMILLPEQPTLNDDSRKFSACFGGWLVMEVTSWNLTKTHSLRLPLGFADVISASWKVTSTQFAFGLNRFRWELVTPKLLTRGNKLLMCRFGSHESGH